MSEIGTAPNCAAPLPSRMFVISVRTRGVGNSQICVVESPADIYAVRSRPGNFRAVFLLMGRLSPLDIRADDIGADRLEQLAGVRKISELILATSRRLKEEATRTILPKLCAEAGIEASRIARGVLPVGGELEMSTVRRCPLAGGTRKIIF